MVSGGVRKSGNHHRNYQPSERPIGLLAVARHTRADAVTALRHAVGAFLPERKLFLVLLDVSDSVTYSGDLLSLVIGNSDVE